MTELTDIERNPPMNGNTGWGDLTDPLHHRLYKERIVAEDNESKGIYSTVSSLVEAKGEETAMEKLVRKSMPYDDGWDLDYVDKLLYGEVPYVDQNGVGSCVGAGAASAVATKVSTEILLQGDPENPFGMTVQQYQSGTLCAVPCVDYAYGCGKMKDYWDGKEFTAERRLGDGSYCAVQIWALKTTGVLPCKDVKDASQYVFPQTKSIQSNAGNRNQFLNKHLEIGRKHLMSDSVRVQNADDLKEVITVLKQPCMICSGWGFAAQEQVSGLGWVYTRRGSWAHNMSLVACVELKGKWYVKVRNQWGSNAHKDGWSFWITIETFSSWIRSAECQSIGELALIPAESIPEFPF